MLAGLWHAPESGKSEGEQRLGTSTIGSSEACMLGGLALKRRWSVARKKAGKSTDKPNLILGINAQVSFVHMHVLTLESLVSAQGKANEHALWLLVAWRCKVLLPVCLSISYA